MSDPNRIEEFQIRMEALWADFRNRDRDSLPEIEEVLPTTHSLIELTELACVDLEHRYRVDADQAQIEDYLKRYPELAKSLAAQHQLIQAERNARAFLDLPIDESDYKKRFPHLFPESDFSLADSNYLVIRELGEGGFGKVYLAHERDGEGIPIREVAIKVLRPGLDPRFVEEIVGRFEREQKAIAKLNHSSVATLFGTGKTSDGLPYFVMEFIEGIPITDYCRQKRLSVNGRLELIQQTCRAVHHAHQKGVIHRDLKPANILIAENDGIPLVKVIDFGLAKLSETQPGQTEKTAHIIGTFQYMSPEQAGGRLDEIDIRSDVYSLGAVLYELLVGQRPIVNSELEKKPLLEILNAICESEVRKPRRRFGRCDRRFESDLRGTPHRRIDAELDFEE